MKASDQTMSMDMSDAEQKQLSVEALGDALLLQKMAIERLDDKEGQPHTQTTNPEARDRINAVIKELEKSILKAAEQEATARLVEKRKAQAQKPAVGLHTKNLIKLPLAPKQSRLPFPNSK